MTADISQVYLHSKFFAKLVKAYSPVRELEDGVVYIKTNNKSEWHEAVSEAKESFANCSMRGSWVMKYDIEALPEALYANGDSIVTCLLGTESNMIMPVFLPDRKEQYYLVGTVADVEYIEPAASFLTTDAQNLMEACLPYALSNMDERKLESMLQEISDGSFTDSWADEIKRLNADQSAQLSFRGLATPNPLATLGEAAAKAADAIKNGQVSYKKRREMIMNLTSTIKKLKNEDPAIQEQGKVEFAQAYQSFGEHELAMLVQALVIKTKPKVLNEALADVADREGLGAKTKYSIVFRPWNDRFKTLGYKDISRKCMFVAEGETLHPLKMSKSSSVIYAMALIQKVTTNKKYAIVDFKTDKKANEKAFKDVYQLLFNDFHKDATQKLYDELFQRNASTPNAPLRSGRLSENYRDIEAALQDTFKDLDEDYSPFLTNATTPLAITAEKIILPPELLAIKIR